MTLYDLDGVLCRTDTMAALVREALKPHPLRALGILPLVLVAAASSPTGAVRPAVNRAIVRRALRGVDETRYTQLASRVGERLVLRGLTDVRLVSRVAAEGERALVVTASERRLARAFLDASGLRHARLAASELVWGSAGPSFRVHNVGQAKVAAVRRAGSTPEEQAFFTDSASDLPLARVSGRVLLVRPSARSVRAFRSAEVSVQVWAGEEDQSGTTI